MAIFAEVFRTISAAGLIQTVAREPVLTDEFTDTVYRAHMGFSLIACAIVLAVAHPFAAFMGAPQIALPLQVLSVVLPISALGQTHRSEEHTSELQSLMRISYAVFCLKKKKQNKYKTKKKHKTCQKKKKQKK